MMVSHYCMTCTGILQRNEDADSGEDALTYTGVSGYYRDMLTFRYEIFMPIMIQKTKDMEINFERDPYCLSDPYSQLAFVELLNILLTAGHICGC